MDGPDIPCPNPFHDIAEDYVTIWTPEGWPVSVCVSCIESALDGDPDLLEADRVQSVLDRINRANWLNPPPV